MNSTQHAAGVALKHILSLGIANLLNHFACDELEVNVRFGFHFTGQHYLSGSNQRFASYFRTGVVSQQFVKHSVGNLIRHFVGVSF